MPRAARAVVTQPAVPRPNPPMSVGRLASGPRRVLAVQRAAGNRAVASTLAATVQRESAPGPKDAARAKVVTAMAALQQKYELAAVTEEKNRSWTLAELRFVDRAFAKLSKVERRNLRGLTLTRVAELFGEVDGRRIPLAGRATAGALIELADSGMHDQTVPLHEVGHIIQSRAVREEERLLHWSPIGRALDRAWSDLVTAQKKLPPTMSFDGPHANQIREFAVTINTLSAAGAALLDSDPEDDVSALQDALLAADVEAHSHRTLVQNDTKEAWLPQLLVVHDRQRDWVAAIAGWMTAKAQTVGKRRDYTAFVDIVTRNKLARRSFAPFTAYVQSNWPRKPGEFFAESYAVYRNTPNYLKTHAKELFGWFERGGHLAPMTPGKAALEDLRDRVPVIGELADNVVDVFGGIRGLPDLIP